MPSVGEAAERGRAVRHVEAVVSVSRVARVFGTFRNTIYDLQRRHIAMETTQNIPRFG